MGTTRTLGVTLGDPTGIGPELVLRVLAAPPLEAAGVALRLYGDAGVLQRCARALRLPWPLPAVELVPVTQLDEADATPGRPSAASGAAQVAYLEAAIRDAEAGALSALCTAPLHKASALAAGFAFPGHTELLAARLCAGPDPVVMMLAGPSLRVALCTTHLALAEVPRALTACGIRGALRTTARALHRDFGVAAPRLWVAGLNPHAGEEGHFGREELDLIAPAIAKARGELVDVPGLQGLQIRGPLVPDVLFREAVHGPPAARPHAVLCMYHDQGLIPLKLLDFDQGVNVTLGLRVPRTSPDHGVAHDIAGRGLARPESMQAALRLGVEIAQQRGNKC